MSLFWGIVLGISVVLNVGAVCVLRYAHAAWMDGWQESEEQCILQYR